MARVLLPLPDVDFDPTEVSVPWKILTRAGHDVVFATEKGAKGACDPKLLTGVVFGQLGAKEKTIGIYRELEKDPAFEKPIAWDTIDPKSFDALVLPGGHAQGMKQYLAGETLLEKVGAFAATKKPIAAICHGVLVLARAKNPATGKSVLHGRKTTCLPKYMERIAYYVTAWRVGRYYRTYDAYVEDEVKDALEDPTHFERGPITLFTHGTDEDDAGAFVVEDGPYVSARWPGDSYLFAKKLAARL
jgi:putative intracellular protease/amidase